MHFRAFCISMVEMIYKHLEPGCSLEARWWAGCHPRAAGCIGLHALPMGAPAASSRERHYQGPSGRLYVSTSIFCLWPTDPPRWQAICLVEAWWFDPLILLTILANCATMAWESPLDPPDTSKVSARPPIFLPPLRPKETSSCDSSLSRSRPHLPGRLHRCVRVDLPLRLHV